MGLAQQVCIDVLPISYTANLPNREKQRQVQGSSTGAARAVAEGPRAKSRVQTSPRLSPSRSGCGPTFNEKRRQERAQGDARGCEARPDHNGDPEPRYRYGDAGAADPALHRERWWALDDVVAADEQGDEKEYPRDGDRVQLEEPEQRQGQLEIYDAQQDDEERVWDQ